MERKLISEGADKGWLAGRKEAEKEAGKKIL